MSASLRRHYPDQVRGYDLSPHYRAPLGLPFANRCKDNTFFRTVAFAGKKRKTCDERTLLISGKTTYKHSLSGV